MTYEEIRRSVAGLLKGDNSKVDETLANDSIYLSMAIRDISIRCIPTVLLSKYDETKTDIFRRVHSEYNPDNEAYDSFYIRKAKISIADADEVEIDEELAQAVVYFMCNYLTNKKDRDYIGMAENIISLFKSNSVDLSQYEL